MILPLMIFYLLAILASFAMLWYIWCVEKVGDTRIRMISMIYADKDNFEHIKNLETSFMKVSFSKHFNTAFLLGNPIALYDKSFQKNWEEYKSKQKSLTK